MSGEKLTALKSCPFCGGEASSDGKVTYSDSHVKEQGWHQSTFYYVNCTRCGSDNKGIIGHWTRAGAIAAWNRRAPDPALVNALEVIDGDLRTAFERAVIDRLAESGFLEIEVRTEALVRCGDGYQDELVNSGWHYWNAGRRDADDYIDQLNVLCEGFGCEPGSDRLHWLHERLSALSKGGDQS